jgi:hypothetical protein
MRLALQFALVVLILSAGCLGGGGTQTTFEPTTADISSGVACDDGLWVSFWGLSQESFWEPDSVRTGYSLPEDTEVLFVAYVDGEVAGTEYERARDGGRVVDGGGVSLNTAYDGKHTVQVVAYEDTNDSEAFENGVDEPCRADGELVQAGPEIVDFSRF